MRTKRPAPARPSRSLPITSIFVALLVACATWRTAACQETASPVAQSETLDYLRELAKRKSAVRHQLARLPEKINEETARVMEALDTFWASDRAASLQQDFIEKVTKQAEEIHLDDQYSTLGTIWAEYKSLVNDDLLVEMTTSYVNKIYAGIKVDQDRLSNTLQEEMKKELDPVFEAAQRSLAETFDGAIQSQFQYWPECFVKFPPVVSSSPNVDTPGGEGLIRRGKTIAGLILILIGRLIGSLVKKVIGRVTRSVIGKLTAKTLGKAIPFIGYALLAWDALDAVTARSRFESTIRQEFFTELDKETKPEALWTAESDAGTTMRSEIAATVKEQLTEWTALAREQTDSFLNAASLADNPAFKDFVAQFDEERKRILQKDPDAAAAQLSFFVDRCEALYGAFGPVCQTASSFDTLEEMLLLSPDKTSLRFLVDALGIDAIKLFEKHGKSVLEASAVLSAPVLAKMVADGKNWQELAAEYRQILGPNPTPAMREGLALAIDNGFDVKSHGNPELLARLGQHADVFRLLCSGGVNPARIRDCLSRDQAAAFLDAMASKSPDLLLQLVNNLEPVRLQRLMAENYVDPVASTWTMAKTLGYDAGRYCAVIRDSEELFEAYKGHSDKGAEIYLSYVKEGVGASQRRDARTAVGLYGMNCPLEVCMDRRNLGLSSFFYGIPLGPQIYPVIYRVNSFIPYLGWILGLGIVALPLYWISRWLGLFGGTRRRSVSRSMTARRDPVDITVRPENDGARGQPQARETLPGKQATLDAPVPPDHPTA